MKTNTLFRVLFVAVLLTAQTAAPHAQCVIFDKPEELFALSTVVFRGTVIGKRPTGIEGTHVDVEIATFRVDQAWKGKPGRQVLVGGDQPFELGKEYLVFAGGKPLSTTLLCHATELVSAAKAKLDWLTRK